MKIIEPNVSINNDQAAVGLDELINPRSVAVIGASEDQTKFGGRLFRMLIKHGYQGTIYPINPMRESLFGIKTFASIESLPEAPDMVIMAIPQTKVKGEIEACVARGARCGIIITSKFSDAGPEGAALEREIVEVARRGNMRLIGPNCLGMISPANRLVLCSSPALEVDALIESPIGFLSQSGALMGTLFDRAHSLGIGFSHCISLGNQADLELCDFIELLINDPKTQVICTYIEGVKSPARFAELARRARKAGKPWLAVKAGKTEDGSRAAFSHTASMAGDFASLEAVCKAENIVLMDDPAAMLLLASAMTRYPGKKVDRAAIITTSGGGGALAADRLSEGGIPLAQFEAQTQATLNEFYSDGQAQNPIDVGGRRHEVGANAKDVAERTASVALSDPQTDIALMVITTAPILHEVTRLLGVGSEASGKPTLYVMQPGKAAEASRVVLVENRLPFTNALGEAVECIAAWRRWSAYTEPQVPVRPSNCSASALAAGTLGEFESKQLLKSIGIPVNNEYIAASVEIALASAKDIGFPLVAKVVSPDIVHKSDVGGVVLGVRDELELRLALEQMQARIAATLPDARIDGFSLQAMEHGEIELILGARRDSQFGPQVVVGSGGVLVEVLKDVVVLPAPIDHAGAIQALQGLKIAPLLQAYRGRPALDVQAVADALVRLSWLASDLKDSDFEVEINPLKVRVQGQGCVAVDARAKVA